VSELTCPTMAETCNKKVCHTCKWRLNISESDFHSCFNDKSDHYAHLMLRWHYGCNQWEGRE
jgi:hypothetical protein